MIAMATKLSSSGVWSPGSGHAGFHKPDEFIQHHLPAIYRVKAAPVETKHATHTKKRPMQLVKIKSQHMQVQDNALANEE